MAATAPHSRTPIWVPIVLSIQLFLTVVIFGLSAYIIHGYYWNTLGYDIFLCLLTWIIVIYHFLTIYVSSMQKLRFPYAALSTSALMVVFWLAAMGATAYLRSTFNTLVNISNCRDDGSTINANSCEVSKRGLVKRSGFATDTGLAIISGIAGLSALVLITYIACLVVEIMSCVKNRKHSSASGAVAPQKQNEAGYEGYRMEQPVHTIPIQQQPQAYDVHQNYVQPYPNPPNQPQGAAISQPVAQLYAQQPYSNSPTPQPYQGSPVSGIQQPYQPPVSPAPTGSYVQSPYQTVVSPGPQESYVQPHVQHDGMHELPHGVDVQRPYEK